jgi:hypothetical protein
MRRLIVPALPLLAALLLVPAIALASEPGSGEISKASPRVIWTGSTENSWFNYTLLNTDNSGDCAAPLCDRFTLKVADGGVDLAVKVRMDELSAQGANGQGGIRITLPDGSTTWTTGESGPEKDLKAIVKKAAAGEYLVDFTNTFVGGEQTYAASAELLVPPAPAASTATTLTLKPFTAKAGRRLMAKVSSNGAVTGLTAVLAKGGKKLATAHLARLEGAGKLTLKPKKKLRPGRYLLTVSGRDAGGGALTAQTAVTIRR